MRNKASERAMLAEVHLRNLIAKFKDLNEKEYKISAIPEVGLFWLSRDGKKFYKDSVSIRDAVSYGDFKILDKAHYDEWSSAVRKVPSWRDKEYEDIPRGRVVLSMNPQPRAAGFIVYLPKVLSRYHSKIAHAFNLPCEHTVFDYSDEHYRF